MRLKKETIIWLNGINRMFSVMETHGVLFEVRNASFFNI